MRISFDRCARCGDRHEDLEVREFTNPPTEATGFAICPTNDEPILVRLVDASIGWSAAAEKP